MPQRAWSRGHACCHSWQQFCCCAQQQRRSRLQRERLPHLLLRRYVWQLVEQLGAYVPTHSRTGGLALGLLPSSLYHDAPSASAPTHIHKLPAYWKPSFVAALTNLFIAIFLVCRCDLDLEAPRHHQQQHTPGRLLRRRSSRSSNLCWP